MALKPTSNTNGIMINGFSHSKNTSNLVPQNTFNTSENDTYLYYYNGSSGSSPVVSGTSFAFGNDLTPITGAVLYNMANECENDPTQKFGLFYGGFLTFFLN